jgi:hypothetical protein
MMRVTQVGTYTTLRGTPRSDATWGLGGFMLRGAAPCRQGATEGRMEGVRARGVEDSKLRRGGEPPSTPHLKNRISRLKHTTPLAPRPTGTNNRSTQQ